MRKDGRSYMCLLCAIAVLMSMAAMLNIPFQVEAATTGLNLSKMQIVIPASATEVEKTAAAELQTYLQKITGIQPEIKTEGSNSGAGIYVGATNYAMQKGVTYPTEGDENGEAWGIKAVNGDLFLSGAPARGPLYAVYHLLEDVLGVRWWNLWEEYVPTGSAIVPADYQDSGVPVMEYREVFVGKETSTDYAFYARNRMNGFTTNIPIAYGGEESYGAPAHVHTFNRYFGSADFAAHPEWFALIDGVRASDGQLCLTNESLKTEFASRLVRNVASDPDAIYSVSPNDDTKFCQCSACQSVINTYGMSGYVLGFVNEMAQAVQEAGYRDAQVEMLVYWAYVEPPKGGVTPEGNVQIRFADNYIDLLHSLDHANNADTVANLQAWIDISSNDVYYWQYVVNYNNNGILPTMFHYGSDIVKLEEMGVNGWFAEQEQCINADFWDMKLWLIAKLMEKPVSGEEYTALMDEFIFGYYGEEAGKYIRDYLYYMYEKAEATNADQYFGTNIIGAEWLSVQDILAGNDFFEKAFAAAGGDAILLRRLRAARSGLDRVIHENFAKWEDQASIAGLTLPFTRREVGKRIYQSMTEQIAVRGAYDPDYPRFYNSYNRRYGEPQYDLPAQFDSVAREHVLDYTAEDLRLAYDYSVVTDTQSQIGKAVCCNAETRLEAGADVLILQNGNTIPIAAYDPAALGGSTHYQIGAISANLIVPNQKYQLYSFTWTVPAMGSGAYIYMVNDWGVQNPYMAAELQDMVGQTVEVYVSMKVTGTVDGSDPLNCPVYYFDRMIVVPAADRWAHDYSVRLDVVEDGLCRYQCAICGDVASGLHAWDAGVETKAPTAQEEGLMLYTCQDCGATKTQDIAVILNSQNRSQTQMKKNSTGILIAAVATLDLAAVVLLVIVLKKRKKK